MQRPTSSERPNSNSQDSQDSQNSLGSLESWELGVDRELEVAELGIDYEPTLNASTCWAAPAAPLASIWIRYSPAARDASGKSIWNGLPSAVCTGTSVIAAPVRFSSFAVTSGRAPPDA